MLSSKSRQFSFFRSSLAIFLLLLPIIPSVAYSAESLESCYEKILNYVVSLGHLPSDSELQTAIQQCDGTFDEVDAVVQSCHQDKIEQFVALGRPPSEQEMEQAIQECSALAQQTVVDSLPDPCADGPEGLESFIPEQYVELYENNDPQFLENFNLICQEQAEQVKSSIVDSISSDYEQRAREQYQEAVDAAVANQWLIKSQHQEIKYLASHGIPIYNLALENTWNSHPRNLQEAALSGTDTLWDFFTGAGLTIGLWDIGSVSDSHSEYQNRIVWSDSENSSVDSHPTHIAGTLVAAGKDNLNAKGMAPDAIVSAYNWNYNISELFNSAARGAEDNGLLISNHSYGVLTGWTHYADGVPNYPHLNWVWGGLDCQGFDYCDAQEDYKKGLYNQDAFDLDYVSYLLPYHLIVKSAGNNNQEGPDAAVAHLAWQWDGNWSQIESEKHRPKDCQTDNGYDCLMPDATAKNILTVGAIDANRLISSYSSQGPTDDGRIKPDLVAKGDGVDSTWLDDSYQELSGTSMATPVVSGSLLLLQQKYKGLNQNRAMRAATLKALAIHSADDIAPPGPDYSYGWGILNTQRAATLLNKNLRQQQVIEARLNNNARYSTSFVASSVQPIIVTLSWTDYPENQHENKVDPEDMILTNDLDLRITRGENTFYPWILDPKNPAKVATTGDNARDNVEQVIVSEPVVGQSYQITISHKGTLKTDGALFRESCGQTDDQESLQRNPHQCFSLIISQGEHGLIIDTAQTTQTTQTPQTTQSNNSTQPGQATAEALINDEGVISLYLPVVQYLEQAFSANLEMIPNTEPLQFKLVDYTASREALTNESSQLLADSLDLQIPLLSFNQQSWSAYLSKVPHSAELIWQLKTIQPRDSQQ